MKNSGVLTEKWNNLIKKKQAEKPQAAPQVSGEEAAGRNKFAEVATVIGRVIFRLRKVVMAAPVVYYALKLAAYNADNLPEMVGLNLQSTGEFAQMITRDAAVNGPLVVTAACLMLMFCSRKSLYPWLISIFSLVLPLLLLITNQYPM